MHEYGPDGRTCTCGDPACTRHIHEQALQETAEYIHHQLSHASDPSPYDFRINYRDARRPPMGVEAIKETLRTGHAWISWMDPKVVDAMRAMFGPPSSGDYG
jgi:hypothetical protein